MRSTLLLLIPVAVAVLVIGLINAHCRSRELASDRTYTAAVLAAYPRSRP